MNLSFTKMNAHLAAMHTPMLTLCNLYSPKTAPYRIGIHFLMDDMACHALITVKQSILSLDKFVCSSVRKSDTSHPHYTYDQNGSGWLVAIDDARFRDILHAIKLSSDIGLDMGEINSVE